MGMVVKSVSGKEVLVDIEYVKRKHLNDFDENLKKQLSEHYEGYVYCVMGYIKQLGKRGTVFVTKEDYQKIKKQLERERKRFVQDVLKKQARMIDSSDERAFRKGLEFDWR